MPETNDPRVFFAAERTLLAWIRTGLGVIGMGFVVARFELHLALSRGEPITNRHVLASIMGASLVLLGSISMSTAALQHVRFCRNLGPGERPHSDLAVWSVRFAAALSFIGVILAAYVLWHAFSD